MKKRYVYKNLMNIDIYARECILNDNFIRRGYTKTTL